MALVCGAHAGGVHSTAISKRRLPSTYGYAAVPAPRHAKSLIPTQQRRTPIATPRSEGRGGGSTGDGFLSGFVVGGVLFGLLGFLAAPAISRSLLGEDARLRLPRFLEDDAPKDPEATKQDLIEKIAQLNASIDDVAAQLRTRDEPLTAEAEARG